MSERIATQSGMVISTEVAKNYPGTYFNRSGIDTTLRGRGDPPVLTIFESHQSENPSPPYKDANLNPRGYIDENEVHYPLAVTVNLPQSETSANRAWWREVRRFEKDKKHKGPRFNNPSWLNIVQKAGIGVISIGALVGAVSSILLTARIGNSAVDVTAMTGGVGASFLGEEMITHPKEFLRKMDPREIRFRRFAKRLVNEGNKPITIPTR